MNCANASGKIIARPAAAALSAVIRIQAVSLATGLSSPTADDLGYLPAQILGIVNPRDRLLLARRRMTDDAEALAQQVTERAVDLVVNALDVNALMARVDVNEVLRHVDVNALAKKLDLNAVLDRLNPNPLLERVDVNPLIERTDVNDVVRRVDVAAVLDGIDVNELVKRIDMNALVEQTDLGAVIARSTRGAGRGVLNAARSQVVGLDQFIDRWVGRLLRRKHPGPVAPPALLPAQAEP
jgi:hypothetical protein